MFSSFCPAMILYSPLQSHPGPSMGTRNEVFTTDKTGYARMEKSLRVFHWNVRRLVSLRPACRALTFPRLSVKTAVNQGQNHVFIILPRHDSVFAPPVPSGVIR